MTGRSGLARIDVADNHDVDMYLLLRHGELFLDLGCKMKRIEVALTKLTLTHAHAILEARVGIERNLPCHTKENVSFLS